MPTSPDENPNYDLRKRGLDRAEALLRNRGARMMDSTQVGRLSYDLWLLRGGATLIIQTLWARDDSKAVEMWQVFVPVESGNGIERRLSDLRRLTARNEDGPTRVGRRETD